jgi:hypothetical protein
VSISISGTEQPYQPGIFYDADLWLQARKMALWYDNSLMPDSVSSDRFYQALVTLNDLYGEDMEVVKTEFELPYVENQLIVSLTASAAQEYINGTYTAWDSLNVVYNAVEIDTLHGFAVFGWVEIIFDGMYNMPQVADMYEMLEGINYADANGYGGDGPNNYPWIIEDKVTFLVREAWGDCPSGCIENYFLYFKQTDTGIDFIGAWDTIWDPQTTPDWWYEGRVSFCTYVGGHGICNY